MPHKGEFKMSFQEEATKVLVKHGKQAAVELIEIALIPALEEAVKKSETKIDDAVVQAIKEPLKQALLKIANGL